MVKVKSFADISGFIIYNTRKEIFFLSSFPAENGISTSWKWKGIKDDALRKLQFFVATSATFFLSLSYFCGTTQENMKNERKKSNNVLNSLNIIKLKAHNRLKQLSFFNEKGKNFLLLISSPKKSCFKTFSCDWLIFFFRLQKLEKQTEREGKRKFSFLPLKQTTMEEKLFTFLKRKFTAWTLI